MAASERSSLDCLALAVLDNPSAWLICPSPSGLATFLSGAHQRAALTEPELPLFRIFGALEEPEFHLPIVAETGHPTLAIKWASALEATHFSLDDAMRSLRARLLQWRTEHGWSARERCTDPTFPADEHQFWRAFANRPGMFLGSFSGTALHEYLAGMSRGGDWLGLPSLSKLDHVVASIAAFSRDAYGSSFAAYRMCDDFPERLLQAAGLRHEA